MRKWTDEDIYIWAKSNFGESSPLEIAVRMNKEMGELLSALSNKEYEVALHELPDLRVFLGQLHFILSYFCENDLCLAEMTDNKMDINDQRKWAKGKDGSFQHVE